MLKLQDTGKQRDFPCAMHKRGTLLHPTYDIPIDLLVSSRPQLIFHICFLNKFRKLSKSGECFFFFFGFFLNVKFCQFWVHASCTKCVLLFRKLPSMLSTIVLTCILWGNSDSLHSRYCLCCMSFIVTSRKPGLKGSIFV